MDSQGEAILCDTFYATIGELPGQDADIHINMLAQFTGLQSSCIDSEFLGQKATLFFSYHTSHAKGACTKM